MLNHARKMPCDKINKIFLFIVSLMENFRGSNFAVTSKSYYSNKNLCKSISGKANDEMKECM